MSDLIVIRPGNGRAIVVVHRELCITITQSKRAERIEAELKLPNDEYKVLTCSVCKPDISGIKVVCMGVKVPYTSNRTPRSLIYKPQHLLCMKPINSANFLEWRDKGKCKKLDVNIFFPPEVQTPTRKEELQILKAQEICMGCPVRAQCLHYAIDENIEGGIWGGATGPQRRSIERRLNNLRRRTRTG